MPIKSQYDKNNIGMDRLVCAFASKTINSAARLVIDFGTAITFDFISAEGEYQGGFILPGIGSTLRVLSSCALLPKKISFKKSRKKIEGEKKIQIPKDTKSSIKQGIEDGFSAMVNSLVKKYSQDLNFGAEDKIFTTGGDFYVIKHYLTFKYIFDSSLVMKGLIFLNKKCL
ncbi:MAG: type III pantothenate kinase [Candidatus Omnitrophota bacterium]